MDVFKDYAYYYNLFYGDKEYDREANVIASLLEKYRSLKGKKILNLGCGTGRHDIELTKLGYSVDGVDISSNMIDIAKSNNPNSKYYVANICNYRPEEKYEFVISMFHVISYQNKNEDVINAFKTANTALEKEGIFLFDVWYGPGVLHDLPSPRIRKVGNDDVIAIRFAQPVMHVNTNVVDVNYEVHVIGKNDNSVKRMEEVHRMRYFFAPEIEEYLCETGFELLTILDCDNLESPTFDSWTAYFIARKIREL